VVTPPHHWTLKVWLPVPFSGQTVSLLALNLQVKMGRFSWETRWGQKWQYGIGL